MEVAHAATVDVPRASSRVRALLEVGAPNHPDFARRIVRCETDTADLLVLLHAARPLLIARRVDSLGCILALQRAVDVCGEAGRGVERFVAHPMLQMPPGLAARWRSVFAAEYSAAFRVGGLCTAVAAVIALDTRRDPASQRFAEWIAAGRSEMLFDRSVERAARLYRLPVELADLVGRVA